MDKKAKNILGYAFWTALAAVLVYFCFRGVDWTDFLEALRSCRWGWVVVSMLLGASVFWLRGVRWRMLLLPMDPSTSRLTCYNAYNICMAANLVIPRSGEVIRCGYVVRHSARDGAGKRLLSFDRVLGALVVERVWDTIITLLMAAILLVAMWRKFGPYLTETLGNTPGATLRLGLLAGVLVFLLAAAVWLLWRMREKGGVWSKVWGFVLGLKDGLVSFTQMKNGWLFLLITAVIWTVYTLMCHTILLALQDIPAYAGMGLTDAFFLMILGSFASVVPVPGGFGAYHSLVAGALASVWGMPFATGMIFATLSHESQAVTQALVGIVSYLHESFIRKS